ncbi:MAG: hypothetical protein MUE50_06695 [Pirellulaceae bacterium]|nr:hypothetical protein [Pirellulaceae bacterium]
MSVIWSKSWLRAICCLLVVCSAAVASADDVLKLVPDNALGVVVVNRVGSTNEKLKSLALRLKVPPFDFLSTAKLTLGLQEALDEKGSVALAAVPNSPNGVPVMVSFVPTGDYAALLKQLQAEAGADGIAKLSVGDRRFVAAQKGGYAVVAEEANQPTLQAVIAATKSIADASGALDAWRAETDAYAVATPTGVKFAQQQIQFGLELAKTQMANQGEQGKAALAGLSMYDALVAAMDKEISHCAVGLRMADDGGIHVVSRTLPVEGGSLAKIASQAKPAKVSPLAGLPQTPYFVAGGGVFTAGSMKSWMELSFGMMRSYPGGDKLTDEQIKKLSEISLKSMRGMRSMALLMGVGEGDEPLYGRMLLVIKTKDAKAYLDNYEAAMAEMMKIFKDADSPLFSFESERMEIDGLPVFKLTMNMEPFLMGQGQGPEAKKMLELMLGSGGKMDIYMAAADQQTVVGAYVSPKQLTPAVKAIQEGKPLLTDEAGVAQTAAMLPPGAQWVGLLSPRGAAAFVGRMVKAIVPPGAQGVPTIPEFPETPPIGFGVQLSPSGLDTDLAIPAAVLEAISQTVRKAIAERGKPEA